MRLISNDYFDSSCSSGTAFISDSDLIQIFQTFDSFQLILLLLVY